MKERGEEASSDIGPLKRPPFTYKILKIKLVKVLVLIISISKNLTTTMIGGMSSTRKMVSRVEKCSLTSMSISVSSSSHRNRRR